MLGIEAGRCVHARCAVAQCKSCVASCPAGAWAITAQGLAFDDALCDGCGLCVAACPAEALSLPAPVPLLNDAADGSREAWLACAQAVPPASGAACGQAGWAVCLQALSPAWLAQQAAAGIQVLRHVTGDCQACPHRPAEPALDFRVRWHYLKTRWPQTSPRLLELEAADARQWKQCAERAAAPQVGKRRFLGSLLRPLQQDNRQPVLGGAPMTSARTLLTGLQQTAENHALQPLWAVEMDEHACTWCGACARLCPESAMVLEGLPTDAGQQALTTSMARMVLDMRACIGCNVCVDVCDQHALRPVAMSGQAEHATVAAHREIILHAALCPQCRVRFYQLATGHRHDEDEQERTLCPVCRQGRVATHNRLVQADDAVPPQA